MPLRIIKDFSDPNHTRRVVYVADRPAGTFVRPIGRMGFDVESGRHMLLPPPPTPTQFLGLDLGQAADFTALALVVRQANGYSVPLLDRIRGVPYPDLVGNVADLMETPELAGKTQLVVDATGVGRPVMDMLRGAGLQPVALTIHGGAKVTSGRRSPRVPKRDLINGLLLTLQAGALRISDQLPHAETLTRELTEMRRKVSAAGHDSYGVWRDGEHDDLVLALAIALWAAERGCRPLDKIDHLV